MNWRAGGEEKTSFVKQVFASVANKYDLMNDLMSLGLHRLWKKRLVDIVKIKHGSSHLDLSSGSGDIAFMLLKKASKLGIELKMTAADPSAEMLEQAKHKMIDRGFFSADCNFVETSAESLPFKDETFDSVTVSFGVRNFSDLKKGLGEIFRVLKPRGTFYCLEFSNVEHGALKAVYECYSKNIIPKVGKLVTGDEDSYQYLIDSIEAFPDKITFKKLMQESGFTFVDYEKLNNGVVAIHFGNKS